MIFSAFNNQHNRLFIEKPNGFSLPRKDLAAMDSAQNQQQESSKKPEKASTEDGFFKTQATEVTAPAEATQPQVSTPLSNLPAPVSQLITANHGQGMTTAPQIYVINTASAPPPPPTIDMEVDTTPAPLNTGGLLGLSPTTSVSLHEGSGGHHAEGHHGGGGQFNWLNGFFPFPVGGGEGFDWWGQFSGGAAVGATLAFMTNGVLKLFEPEYIRPVLSKLNKVVDGLNRVPFVGQFFGSIVSLGVDLFTPRSEFKEIFDEATQRRYRVVFGRGAPSRVDASRNKGLWAKLGINGGFVDYAQVELGPEPGSVQHKISSGVKGIGKVIQDTGNWMLKLFGRPVPPPTNESSTLPTSPLPNDTRSNRITFHDVELADKKTFAKLVGDATQPSQVILTEKSGTLVAALEQIFVFNNDLQCYQLKQVQTVDTAGNKIKLTFDWDQALQQYRYKVPEGIQLSETIKGKLKNLANSGLKTLDELVPLIKEILGVDMRRNTNAIKNTFGELLKYVPLKGMALGALLGSVFAMYYGYYEMGHKHLSIDSHGGEGKHKDDNLESVATLKAVEVARSRH